LNGLPEVKRFLTEDGHADLYNVKVTFIQGNQPVLVLRNETDETVEEIDLSDYSTEGLHALMLEKGIKKEPYIDL